MNTVIDRVIFLQNASETRVSGLQGMNGNQLTGKLFTERVRGV
jgi:hypothetical protein